MHGFYEILHKSVLSAFSFFFSTYEGTSKTVSYLPDLSLFPVLPEPVRDVEHNTLKITIYFPPLSMFIVLIYLEEKDEWHPLVVAVVCFILVLVSQTRMGNFCSNHFSLFVG